MGEYSDQSGLARRLGITARQVRNLEADGVILRTSDDLYDLAACQTRYEIFRARDVDTVAAEIERASAALTSAMNALLSTESVEQRRKMMRATAGPLIGVLDGWLRLACALSPAGARREFEQRFVTMIVSRAASELLAACHMRVANDDDDDAGAATADAERYGTVAI
jgi:hypothetical protein